MSRYIKIPAGPAIMVDLMTDEPSGKMTWAQLVRALCASAKVRNSCDMLDLYDHRKRLIDAKPGATESMPDDVWSAMCSELRRPEVLSAHFAASPECLEMARSILDAPSKAPEKSVAEVPAEANGASGKGGRVTARE